MPVWVFDILQGFSQWVRGEAKHNFGHGVGIILGKYGHENNFKFISAL